MRKIKLILMIVLVLTLLSAAGCSSNSGGTQETAAPADTQTTTPAADAAAETTFTLDELKAYDGQNGNPAYIAVDGVVYDVSNASGWREGKHKGNSAGTDLTDAIANAPHGKGVLDKLPVVGKLE